ncbi:MAG: right-handed parallel beta-helix repeat-containing protein [Eggerthellaceae bacterium]|nr:right-handed parallel beta-helix repeat-containing protein [Eggerthellaceae bacterium]
MTVRFPRKHHLLLALAIATALLVCPCAQALAQDGLAAGSTDVTTAETTSKGANLVAAQNLFKVQDQCILVASTPSAIEEQLATAGGRASAAAPWIVYAPAGTYAMPKKLVVPKNVIFVAEASSSFYPTTSSNFTQFFWVYGSLYGGTYDGKNMAYYGLRFGSATFSDATNGSIRNADVKNAQVYGIVAMGTGTKNAKVDNCRVTGITGIQDSKTKKWKGGSAISAAGGARIYSVTNCTASACKQSGINLSHADIDIISGNTLKNNQGHGISTDIAGDGQNHCYMKTVTSNTIESNGVNGVYIDKNCCISSTFAKNTVSNNKLNGLSIAANGVVKGIANNKFNGNGRNKVVKNRATNLRVAGSKAVAYIGSGNTFTRAGNNNITIDNRAVVYLSGSNNYITSATNNGISLKSRGSLIVKSGKKNRVTGNGGFGIRIEKRCTCKISNFVFGKNKTGAVKAYAGCTFTHKKCGLSTKRGAKNRIT